MSNLKLFIGLLLAAGTTAGCDTALERNLEGKQVSLMAPVNNLISVQRNQGFYWEYLEGAISYRLRIVSPRFDSIVRVTADTIISRNNFTVELVPGDYQWRVEARNNNSVSAAGEIRNLKIQ